jgi:uncharacterized repeat protein (TIGR01451 family)
MRPILAGLLSITLVALLGVVFPGAVALAAGAASVSISPSTTTVAAGATTTFTVSLSCSVTGGCAAATVTFPVTTYTDLTGTSVNDSGQFGVLSCSGWTKSATSSTVTYTYTAGSPAGTLATGSSQCTFVYSTTNYRTPNNQTFTLTPTINGSNFTSSPGNSATVTVTAAEKLTFAKRATTSTVGGAVTKVGQGAQFSYVLHIDCPGDGAIPGAIGTKSLTVTDQLPANFTYQSYQTIYNANNGNFAVSPPALPLFPGTVTTPNAGNNNTFTYSDPGGTTCNSSIVTPGRDIQITGTASTAGVPDAIGSTIANSATATWTYLDGTPGTVTSTTNTSVVSAVPDPWLSKGPTSQSPSNQGQYVYPPTGGANQWYTYPGDWNGSGISAQYAINLATNGVAAGVDFAVQDPMPCQTNNASPGTAANPNYSSNAPGTPCTKPAFVPTRVIVTGFTPTASDSVTVVHTDGTTTTIAWDSTSQTWPIPTSPAVSELDFPPFASEGSNTSATLQLIVEGYAAPDVLTTSLLTNTATGNAYLVGSNSPLTTQETFAASVMVASPTPPSGVVVQPGIWPRYNGGSTCTEVVSIGNFGGNGPQSNYVEVAQAPSKAFYFSYLAPAGATVTAGTDQTFTFTPHSFSVFPAGPAPGAVATTGTITATPTPNYNGTGRTLLQWVIPAGTITVAGDYFFTGGDLTVDLGPGCAGVYQNDATVGYGGPITVCPPGKHFPPSNGINNALNTTTAPDPTNYCGVSQNITVAPTNPAFSVNKTVQGNLDAAPIGSGGVGNVSPTGGTATYQISFANTGQSNLTNPVMYDLLPRVGDTQASSTQARGSQFAVTLTGVGTPPAGVTVSYSTATNPCRSEVLSTNPGCTNDWSTTAPATLGDTTALKFAYAGTVTVPGAPGTHGFTVPLTVSTPNTTPGQIAWNTVGTNAFAGVDLMGAAESSKTGLQAEVGPTITKSTTATSYSKPGDSITYTYKVANNTSVPLTGVGVVDLLTDAAATSVPPTVTCQSLSGPSGTCSGATTSLQPGQVATFSATYVVTQDDLEHGSIADTGTVTATPPTGGTLHNTSNVVTVPAVQTPKISMVKTASPTTVTATGQTVTYSFFVTNTGNVTLTGVSVADTVFSGTGTAPVITCPVTTLAPATSTTCTGTYAVTQADVDAGSISNTATASGTPPSGPPVTSPASTATVTAEAISSLSLLKTASPTTVTAAGQTVTYSFRVTNTGNQTLTGVSVTESAFSGTGTPPVINCPVTSVAPQASTTCTGTYTVTQADIDTGSITNTATASGTPPTGPAVSSASSTATITAEPVAALTLVKTANPTVITTAGQTVTYSFLETNTGNATLTGVSATETAFSGTGTPPVISCPVTTLAPLDSTTCTGTYTVTQADIDAGTVTNTATSSGTPPTGPAVTSAPSTATVTVAAAPALSLTKSATPTVVSGAGQSVAYSFFVTNTGNVTLTGVSASETAFSGTNTQPVITCPVTTLVPLASTTCTGTYTVTQADIDAGSITNTATASGTPPTGPAVTSAPSSATVTAHQVAGLSLLKTASPTTVTSAGQTVTYSFAVTNTGNQTLTGVSVADTAFSGTGTPPVISCPVTTLAPQASTTCTGTYAVTQADIDAGSITNTATASGTPPTGPAVSSAASTATVTAQAISGVLVVKTASRPTVTTAGQLVTYSFHVVNTGNQTLSNITITETQFSGTGAPPVVTCPVTTLEPQDTTDCTGTYTVTQADIDAGSIRNTATVSGTPPTGPAITSAPSNATVTAIALPGLGLDKSADPTSVDSVGDVVDYTFAVTNTGNVTLTGVGIDEQAFSGSGTPSTIDCPSGPLAPGSSVDCTASYSVTQSDLDAGSVSNTATASGNSPSGAVVSSSPSTATITMSTTPALALIKTANATTITRSGQKIAYRFLITNTGNVTLADVTVKEGAFSGTGHLSAVSGG